MSTPIHGYLIVDKESGNPDWDADLHPTVAAAIESLCETKSFCRTPDDPTGEDLTYWAEVYAIHPVGPAMDPDLAGALADPEGHALVQAIHDRKETATLPALVVRHDTPTLNRDDFMRVTYVRCTDCSVLVATLYDGMLTMRSGRARDHFETLVLTAMEKHREELEANRA